MLWVFVFWRLVLYINFLDMNWLYTVENPQSGNIGESPEMKRLRKEVMTLCAAIMFSTSMDTHASDHYYPAQYLNNKNTSAYAESALPRENTLSYDASSLNIVEGLLSENQAIPEITTVSATTDAQKLPFKSAIVGNDIRSVDGFMQANHWDKTQWKLLIDAGTVGNRGGDRVRKAERDLYKWHAYFLARSEEEADMISRIVRERTNRNKVQSTITPTPKVAIKKPITPKIKNSYTVTRTDLDEEANTFLTELSQQKSSYRPAEMYKYKMSPEEMHSIMKNMGLDEAHLPIIITLMSHIARHESTLNYGAFWQIIEHKSSHRWHRAAGLLQIMPLNLVAWSKKHFGTILPYNDINQEKIWFAQIAEYYQSYISKWYSLHKIAEQLSIAWYGSVKVKWLQSPSDYAKWFISSVFSDTDRVAEAKKILTSIKKWTAVKLVQSKPENIVAAKQAGSNEIPSVATTQEQVVLHTQTITSNPAVNDPLYFRSSEAITSGMNKVIDLNRYLKTSTSKREAETEFKWQIPSIGVTISHCQAELRKPITESNLLSKLETQLMLGNAIKKSMVLANNVVANTTFVSGIEDTERKIAKVFNIKMALDTSRAQKKEKAIQDQREARIVAMWLDGNSSVRFAENMLGLRAA
jgi:hypothetical protein